MSSNPVYDLAQEISYCCRYRPLTMRWEEKMEARPDKIRQIV